MTHPKDAVDRVVATRGDGAYLLVVDHHDPQGEARVYDRRAGTMSPPERVQAILKFGYWDEVLGEPPLAEVLKTPWPPAQGGRDLATPPKRPPRYRPIPRWGSQEGRDPAGKGDVGTHQEALGQPLAKALPTGAPRRSRQAAAPVPPSVTLPPRLPEGAEPGHTYHYDPNWGTVQYGAPQGQHGLRTPQIHDHVAILPGPDHPEYDGRSTVRHARIVGHVTGGVRIRYTRTGHEEDLQGPQRERSLTIQPGNRYGGDLNSIMAAAHERDAARAEAGLAGLHGEARHLRRAFAEGPEVGQRFREVHQDISQPHPYGPQHEIVHVYPSGRSLVVNRETGQEHELEAVDHSRMAQHDAVRVEPPNRNDEHGDHLFYAKLAGLLHPEETVENAHDEEDNAAADRLGHMAARAYLAAPHVRGLTGGAHGIDKLLQTYDYQHGNLHAVPTAIVRGPDGKIEIRGDIHHVVGADRHQIGGFTRILSRDADGHLVMDHAYMTLPHEHQRTGFANGFNEHAEGHYRDLGIHRSVLLANISVGKYAWAKQGYDFESPAERQRTWDNFKRWADHNGHTFPKRDYDRLRKTGRAWDLADYNPTGELIHAIGHDDVTGERHIDGHYPLGKAYLLSDASKSWEGVKHLADGSPHQAQAARYRDERERRAMEEAEHQGKAIRRSWATTAAAWGVLTVATLTKALPRRVERPGSRGGRYWVDQHGQIRYGSPPEAPPPVQRPNPTAPPLPPAVPDQAAQMPHYAEFGPWSSEAAALYLRGALFYGDGIQQIAAAAGAHPDRIAQATSQALTALGADDHLRLVRALLRIARLRQWDHAARRAQGDPAGSPFPAPLDRLSPLVVGAQAAGLPQDAARMLAAIITRGGGDLPADEEAGRDALTSRLTTPPETPEETDLVRGRQPLLLKAVMRPGSRGGHVYWENGKLRYGIPTIHHPKQQRFKNPDVNPTWLAPGRLARRILATGHRVLFLAADNSRHWGQVITASGELLSVLPDDAVKYDLLHTVCVPAERVIRVIPDNDQGGADAQAAAASTVTKSADPHADAAPAEWAGADLAVWPDET